LITCVLGCLKDHAQCDFHPVHLLQVSFGHSMPLAASQATRRKDMEVLHKCAQPWITHMRIFSCLLDPTKTCSFIGLIKLCHILTGLFWDAVDSFACLFDGFFYTFSDKSTSKADKFDNLRSMKIFNTPLTQTSLGSVLRDPNKKKTSRQKRVQIAGLGGWNWYQSRLNWR